MRPRIVPARSKRIPLSDGDWIDVKEALNHGEYQKIYEQLATIAPDGQIVRHPHQLATAMITAYLVDWSFTDADNRPVMIRDASQEDIAARLNLIDQETFLELKEAIEAHVNELEMARQLKKTIRPGSEASETISPSLAGVAGGTSG